jgi:hypothetical protein
LHGKLFFSFIISSSLLSFLSLLPFLFLSSSFLFFISCSSFFCSSETERLRDERQRDWAWKRDREMRVRDRERDAQRLREIGRWGPILRWDQDPISGGSDRDETERESWRRSDRSRILWWRYGGRPSRNGFPASSPTNQGQFSSGGVESSPAEPATRTYDPLNSGGDPVLHGCFLVVWRCEFRQFFGSFPRKFLM